MKPLELTWYPPAVAQGHCELSAMKIHHRQRIAKRFTDAELAAEVHCMDAELLSLYELHDFHRADTTRDRYWTLHRFATTDSHDQEET